MEIGVELIEKFFQNKCTKYEAKKVNQYFLDNPNELDKYLSNKEWIEFNPIIKIHPSISNKMKGVIKRKIKVKAIQISWFKYSAAAVFISLIICSYLFFKINDQKSIVQKTILDRSVHKPLFKILKNNTKNDIQYKFEDNSTVVLHNNSELHYYIPFEKNRRFVTLKGTATFEVSKDKLRPFIVETNELVVTVLGTKFKVDANEKLISSTVMLYEGKVAVKKINRKNNQEVEQFTLLPGDELRYNKVTKIIKIVNYNKQNIKASSTKISDNLSNSENWYMFNNQSLDEVFDQLSEIYNVKIIYDKVDLRNKNFIGKISKTDSLQNILNDIVLLNQLKLIKRNNSYFVRKK